MTGPKYFWILSNYVKQVWHKDYAETGCSVEELLEASEKVVVPISVQKRNDNTMTIAHKVCGFFAIYFLTSSSTILQSLISLERKINLLTKAKNHA